MKKIVIAAMLMAGAAGGASIVATASGVGVEVGAIGAGASSAACARCDSRKWRRSP